ncbi:oligosaccharide flippase family protein [Neiella marina]|uniref:Oligosaccharide flippase family protein n=1 Tax=Neiella holothuriorum TaxID=2870530 RepID=A0ABS7EHC0_9GAMM|nr:oligosaccharide flippase family protein [Neiella holothuriorum]MBW8191624.1 oligosaccharide flippase family protein [Neiella holothuriorum]
MSDLRKSLVYSVTSKYFGRLVALISVIIVSRLLTPDELGVYAIASALVLIAGELKSFGAGTYLIREKEIDSETVGKALGVSCMISWSVGALLVVSAWSIEQFYQKPDIAIIVVLLAASFFLAPHIGVGKSLLERDFRFSQILVIDIVSRLGQLASVVILISLGLSYFSLALSVIINNLLELLLVLWFKPKYYQKLPAFKNTHVIFKFGMLVTVANFIRQITRALPDLIIGKVGTSREVAFYSRGMGYINFLSMTINSGIRPVIGPYLSEKRRNRVDLIGPYLLTTKMMAGIMIPALAVSSYASYVVIVAMFGEQWIESAPLVSALCVATIIHNMIGMAITVLITAGFERQVLYRDIVLFCVTALSIYFLYPYGLQAVTYGAIGTATITFLITISMLKRLMSFSIYKQVSVHFQNFAVAAICVAAVAGVDQFIDYKSIPVLVALLVVAIVSMTSWLGGVLLVRHPLGDEILRVGVALKNKLMRA